MSDQSTQRPATGTSGQAPADQARNRLSGGVCLNRIATSAAFGSVASLAVAALEARWIRSGLEDPPGRFAVTLADAGLVVPLCLLTGVLVGLASWLMHGSMLATASNLLALARGDRSPARVALFGLAPLGAMAWATLSAQLARQVLGVALPVVLAATLITLGSLLLAALSVAAVMAALPPLSARLEKAADNLRWVSDPLLALLLALGLNALLLAHGAYHGTVSGEGGLLQIFGVLKRQELDLRAPALLSLLALGCYAAPALLRRLPTRASAIGALLPLALTGYAGGALNGDVDLAGLIERGAPLGAPSLKLLRRLRDADGDGSSALFGGGDCNDADPAIGPAADDIPGNGIDEDCSGSDLILAPTSESDDEAQAAAKAPPKLVPDNGNVVLITIDTLRHEMGYSGYPRPISPNLDALAKRSLAYRRAYALASYTGKSVGPMLIGKYGSETHRNWGHFNKFGTEDTFVAERIQKAGIATMSVHAHRYFGKWGGLERGFDELDLSAAPPEGAKWATDETVTGAQLTDATIALLAKQKADGRFFLWVHYLDPHADYIQHKGLPKFGNRARDLYDGEVAYTDQQIGRLLDHIAKAPWASRTSIVVTSDHGESFGENKMWRHGVELWEPVVRVPLIVHVPGVLPAMIEQRRSLIDLAPTILELLGLPAPTGEGDDFFSGQSLLADAALPDGAKPAQRDIMIDMPGGPYNESRRAFIHGDLKMLISRGTRKELFDLASDPKERKNVWGKRRKEIEEAYARAKAKLREIEVKGKRK